MKRHPKGDLSPSQRDRPQPWARARECPRRSGRLERNTSCKCSNGGWEASGGFEPPIRVLQTPALPLGYDADLSRGLELYHSHPARSLVLRCSHYRNGWPDAAPHLAMSLASECRTDMNASHSLRCGLLGHGARNGRMRRTRQSRNARRKRARLTNTCPLHISRVRKKYTFVVCEKSHRE